MLILYFYFINISHKSILFSFSLTDISVILNYRNDEVTRQEVADTLM